MLNSSLPSTCRTDQKNCIISSPDLNDIEIKLKKKREKYQKLA